MPVKCADCGFLTMREWVSRELAEVPEDVRRSGDQPPSFGKQERYEFFAICFVREQLLRFEQIHPNKEPFLKVINAERECEKFTKYEQGFTPKEHRQMLQDEALKKFQAARDAAQFKFQSDEAAANRRHNWLALAVAIFGPFLVAEFQALTDKPAAPPVVNVTVPAIPQAPPVVLPAPAQPNP